MRTLTLSAIVALTAGGMAFADEEADLVVNGEIDMVVNSPSGPSAAARADGYAIRAATTAMDKPIITTVQQLAAAVLAIEAVMRGDLDVTSLQVHAAALDLFGVEAGA